MKTDLETVLLHELAHLGVHADAADVARRAELLLLCGCSQCGKRLDPKLKECCVVDHVEQPQLSRAYCDECRPKSFVS